MKPPKEHWLVLISRSNTNQEKKRKSVRKLHNQSWRYWKRKRKNEQNKENIKEIIKWNFLELREITNWRCPPSYQNYNWTKPLTKIQHYKILNHKQKKSNAFCLWVVGGVLSYKRNKYQSSIRFLKINYEC